MLPLVILLCSLACSPPSARGSSGNATPKGAEYGRDTTWKWTPCSPCSHRGENTWQIWGQILFQTAQQVIPMPAQYPASCSAAASVRKLLLPGSCRECPGLGDCVAVEASHVSSEPLQLSSPSSTLMFGV